MDSETHHSGNYIICTDGSYKKYNKNKVKASGAYIILNERNEVILKGKNVIPNTKEKLLNSTGYQELKRFHKMLNYHGKSHYKKQKFKEKRQTFQWNWYYSNLRQVFRLYKELGKELTLEIEWCQGHAGIFGNEQANSLARKVIKKSESK